MEFAVLSALTAASYMMSSKAKSGDAGVVEKMTTPTATAAVTSSLRPSTKTPYESDFVRQVKAHEQATADAVFSRASPRGYDKDVPRVWHRNPATPYDGIKLHNNMQPFFSGQQPPGHYQADYTRNMETFTGAQGPTGASHKQELPPMFEPVRDMSFVSGMGVKIDDFMPRVQASSLRQNELPFEQLKVGRGLGKNADPALPTGGFHQFDAQDMIMPRTIDELRAKNNPKVIYSGTVKPGMGTAERATLPNLARNRPETVFDVTDRMVPSKSSVNKPAVIGEPQLKHTSREDFLEHVGNPENARTGATVGSGERTALKNKNAALTDAPTFYVGSARPQQADAASGAAADNGRSAALAAYVEKSGDKIYDCPDESPLGIVTSIVKALSAPLIDALRGTRKDATVETYRLRGNVTPQFPPKGTVQDPQVTARVTIRETTSDAADPANLAGPVLNVVHDPRSVARTTIKETLIHDENIGVLTGPTQVIVYDPEQIARVTVRETTDQVYFPVIGNVLKKGKVKDPADGARATMKETTVDQVVEGNFRTLPGKPGAYADSKAQASVTNRQITAQEDRYGTAQFYNPLSGLDGQDAPFSREAPTSTNRETTADFETMGGALASTFQRPASREAADNFRTSASREVMMEARVPTSEGVKMYLGVDTDETSTRDRQFLPEIEHQLPHVHNKIARAPCVPDTTHTPIRAHCNDKEDEADQLRFLVDVHARNDLANPLVLPSFNQMSTA